VYLRTEVPGKSNNLNNYSVSTKDCLITEIVRRESAKKDASDGTKYIGNSKKNLFKSKGNNCETQRSRRPHD